MAQSLGEMDVDLEFDYDLGGDDLLLIEQTEQIYLSTQQNLQTASNTPTPSLRNEPSTPMSWNPAQEAVGSVDWNPAQETITLEQENIEIARSNIDTSAAGSTGTSHFGPEAERIMENYRFQIERLQMNMRDNSEVQQQQTEMLQLKEMLRDKDRELIHLKKELYKYKEQPSSDQQQQKRAFPGLNVYDKSKVKKLSRPSPFTQAAASFSQSRASPSPSLSSQSTSSQLENIPNDKASVKMPRLASLASPMISPLKPVADVKAEPEPPVNFAPHDRSPSTSNRPTRSQPRKIRKRTENESKQTLLTVLLTPHFQRWNTTHHDNKKDINTALTRPLIKKLSEEFSLQFIPDPEQSPPQTEYERLQLLASDVNNSILKGDSTSNTIRILLNIFNISLKIAIKCKLYKIIHNIVNVIKALTENFPIARKYLQRDITFETNSLLAQFAKSLALFPFYETHSPQLLEQVENRNEVSFKDTDRITETFKMKPSVLYKDLHLEESTEEALAIVRSILELFICVGPGCKNSIFIFLLTDADFLNLLNPKRPYDIIYLAMSVLETSLTNDSCLIDYTGKELKVLRSLTDLISTSKKFVESVQWYNICIKVFALLQLILGSDLPENLAIEASRVTLEKVNDAMDSMAARYSKNANHLTDSIRERRAEFIKCGLQTIYCSIKWCPTNVFKCTEELRANTVLQMVSFFQNSVEVDQSLSRTLTRLVTLLTPKRLKKAI